MLHEHIWEIMPDVWSEFSFPQKEKSQSGKLWHVHREIHCHRARSEKMKIMCIIYLLSTVTSDLFFRNWVSNDSPHWAASLCPTYFWWNENKAVFIKFCMFLTSKVILPRYLLSVQTAALFFPVFYDTVAHAGPTGILIRCYINVNVY